MKKLIMMIAGVALISGFSQAASVVWNSGALLNPETGLPLGSTTGIYLAQVFFYTDAGGTTPLAAGVGAQVSDTSSSALSVFNGTTASVFPASTPVGTYWAQLIITSDDYTISSNLVGLNAIPPSGNLNVNFTLGTGIVGGGNQMPTGGDNNGWEPVPEPTSIALLVLGVTAIGLRRRVRKA